MRRRKGVGHLNTCAMSVFRKPLLITLLASISFTWTFLDHQEGFVKSRIDIHDKIRRFGIVMTPMMKLFNFSLCDRTRNLDACCSMNFSLLARRESTSRGVLLRTFTKSALITEDYTQTSLALLRSLSLRK